MAVRYGRYNHVKSIRTLSGTVLDTVLIILTRSLISRRYLPPFLILREIRSSVSCKKDTVLDTVLIKLTPDVLYVTKGLSEKARATLAFDVLR